MTPHNSQNQPTRQQIIGDIQILGDDNIFNAVSGDNNTLHFFKYEVTPHGGVVNILPPEQAPRITTLPTPINLRPRFFQKLLGRQAEMQQIIAALETSQTIELYGAVGVGKSVLLRYLAYHPVTESRQLFPDGVIYFHSHRQEPIEDIQQRLFDAFYKSEPHFKPSPVRVRQDLHNKSALVILDNASLSRKDIEKLWEITPSCVYVFSSVERNLWEGQPIQVNGISQDDALTLIGQELGRSLTAQEQAAAKVICTDLNGHPLEILQHIAGVRKNKEWLADVAGRVQKDTSHKARIEQLIKPLEKQQRSVLAALAALGGIALTANQVSAIADVQGVEKDLDDLETMHLVQQEDSRYSLSTNLLDSVKQIENLTPYIERAVSSFTRWAQHATPEELKQEYEAVSHLLQWSVEQGRWNDVLVLGKPLESTLAVSGQWGLQAQILQWQLQAARKLENQSSVAYIQHQLGARALCLGHTDAAQNLLKQAINLRVSIGETNQANISRKDASLSSYIERMGQQKEKASPTPLDPDSQEFEPEREPISRHIQSETKRPTQRRGLDIARLIGTFTSVSILVLTGLQIWKFFSSQKPNPSNSNPSPSPIASSLPSPETVSPSPTISASSSPETPSLSPTPSTSPSPKTPSPSPTINASSLPETPPPNPTNSPSLPTVSSPTPPLSPAPSISPIPDVPRPVPTSSPRIDSPSPSPTPIPSVIPSPLPSPEPKLQLNAPPSLDFGSYSTLTGNVQTLWVENIGTAPLSVYPITFDPANGFHVVLNWDNCSNRTLAPGGKCNITVQFDPTSSGSYRSTLIISSNGGTGNVILMGHK